MDTLKIKLLVFQRGRRMKCLDRVCCFELKTAVLIIGVFNLVSLIILLFIDDDEPQAGLMKQNLV